MSTHAIAERAPILSCLALLLFLGACGAGRSGLESAQSLSLRVVNTLESASGQAAQFSVLQRTDGNDITVDLEVHGASELQACGVELSYSAEDWHLVDSQGTALLGDSDSVLELVLDAAPGLLAFGTVQTRGCTALPFSGSGKLASFRFAPGPAGQRRTVSAINSSPPAAEWDEGSLRLSWPYGNVGDYDQNSEVNIADLTPIGIHFGESSADPLSALAAIDGDSNGEINIADITPIGINYRNGLSGYRLWELASPLDWQGPQDTPALADIAFGDAVGVPSLDRLQFSHTYGADPGYRWLRLAVVNVDEFSNVSDEIFTYPSLQPLLSLVDAETLNGSGSPLDPWISGPLASHVLQLELQDSTAVTADPLSEFLLHGPAGAALTGNMLDFDATASGDYYVTATYDGVPSAPYSLHFHINVAPQAVLSADHTSGHVPLAVLLDGSQSSDTDGEIVLAEWDFDNDGTFDADSGNQLTISHTYSSEGSFEAVLRLTDDGGASSLSDPLAITVLPPNQPPLADLQAFPTSGNTPLLVSLDASASSDPDGTLSLADWDFDNDGIFDLSGTAELVIDHVYTVPGDYQAVVRVYDDDAAFADSDPVAISVGGNFPPVPVLTAVPYSGLSPLSVLLDASASSDPDGEIVLVEWDFSGDGEYDQSGTQLSTGHLYTGDGEFHAMVRLTDNDGGVSVSAPVTVTVGVEAGSAPLALLSADPLFGAAPLLVTLDASGSTDPDDDIVLTEFDFDNDGSWDEQDAEDYITTHEYALDGSYEVRLRVTDAEGHRSVSDPLTIIVNSSAPPTAVFTAVSFSGTAPFDVVADASASMDPDGLIALYEWDADDDGIFEYSTTQNDAQFSLLAVGSYTIHLRVTDNDGLSHAVSHDFTVQPGSLSWQDYGTGITNPLNAHYAVSGGRPAVAWQSSLADLYFKRSADSAGHSWPVSGVLVDGNLTDYPGGSMRLLDFAVSGGVPLMVSIKGTNAQADHDMFICRGLNADGSSFATPQKIISGLQNRVDRDLAGWPLLADFSGLPAICYGSDQSGAWQHIRALDSQGVGWPAAVDAVNGSRSASLPIGSLLSDPAGGAQLFYFSNNQISTNRDPNGDGVGWNARQDLFSESGVVRVQAIASSGSVVLLYAISTGAGNIELYASHADSPAYTAWSSPFPVASLAASPADCQLLLDNGKPALLVSGNLAGLNGVQYLRSHDARGSHWSTPQRISSQSGGELRSAAFVNGHLTAMHLRSNGILRLLSRE